MRVIREFVIRYLRPKKTHERIEKVKLGLLYLTTHRGGLYVCVASAERVPRLVVASKTRSRLSYRYPNPTAYKTNRTRQRAKALLARRDGTIEWVSHCAYRRFGSLVIMCDNRVMRLYTPHLVFERSSCRVFSITYK